MVLGNRRLTIRELVDMIGISFGSVQTILRDHLGLGRFKSRLVPKFLNFFEKERRVQACESMLSDLQGVYKKLLLAMNLGFILTMRQNQKELFNVVRKSR